MADRNSDSSPNVSLGGYFAHFAVLLAAMAGLLALGGPVTGAYMACAAGGVYLIGVLIAGHRRGREVGLPEFRVLLALMLYFSAVPLAAAGAIAFATILWLAWAFKFFEIGGSPVMQVTLCAGALVGGLLLLMFLVPILARNGEGAASRFLRGVRKQGFGHFHLFWLGSTAIFLGIACIAAFLASINGLYELELARRSTGSVTAWELSTLYPVLLVAPFAGAAMLAMGRYAVVSRAQMAMIVRAYADGAEPPAGPDRRARAVLGLFAAGGWAATLFVVVYPIHLGLVAALGPVNGMQSLTASADAVDAWVTRQREAGRTAGEIAEALNRIGFWTPERPAAGLATLVENPGDVFTGTCSLRTAAGVVDPANHAGHAWLSPEMAASDVKYCIVATCPSPVAWNAPPALLLASSHASQAKYWSGNIYIDIFADGRAAAPGGYCNADGTLADNYRG